MHKLLLLRTGEKFKHESVRGSALTSGVQSHIKGFQHTSTWAKPPNAGLHTLATGTKGEGNVGRMRRIDRLDFSLPMENGLRAGSRGRIYITATANGCRTGTIFQRATFIPGRVERSLSFKEIVVTLSLSLSLSFSTSSLVPWYFSRKLVCSFFPTDSRQPRNSNATYVRFSF